MNGTHPHITKLKEYLQWAQSALERYQTLNAQREEIENKIEKLKEEIEIQTHRLFRLEQRENPKEYEKQAKFLDTQKQLLAQLKHKKQELDHLLDEIDDLSPDQIEILQEDLINQILYYYPEYQSEQEQRSLLLRETFQTEKELTQLYEACLAIKEILQVVIQTRQSIKGRGILNYIFGISPNKVIEQHLKEGQRIAKAEILLLQGFKERQSPTSALYLLLGEIKDFFIQLEKNCKASWGFNHIDTIFFQAGQQVNLYLPRIKHELEQIQTQRKNLETQREQWLQQF